MRSLAKLTLLALLVCAAVLAPDSASARPANAVPVASQAPPSGTCDALQVVFLVDQSRSMSDTIDNVPPSDPDGLRFFGPAEAVTILSALRFQSYQTSNIAVALVNFGDLPSLGLPWTAITPNNQADNDALLQKLAPAFQPIATLGNTNHLGAFQNASSLFEQAPPQQNGCPVRAVILLTDGQSYLPTDGFNWASHLDEVVNYVKTYMSPPDYQIYVIGIDKQNTFWQQNSPYWEKVTGDPSHAQRVVDQVSMTSRLLDIILQLAGKLTPSGSTARTTCVGGGSIDVSPFVQELQLILTKDAGSNQHIDLLDPAGARVTQGSSGSSGSAVKVDGYNLPIETITIDNPRPGKWTLQTQLPANAKDRCQVRMLSFDAVAKLVTPADSATLTQFKSAPLDFRIVDAAGKQLPEYTDPNYRPKIDITLTGPSQTQPLTLNPGPDYQFTGQIVPLEGGPHKLHVKVVTQNPDGSDYAVFDKDLATLQVTAVSLVLKQRPTGIVAQHRDFKFQFELQDQAHHPVQIDLTPAVTLTVGQAGKAAQAIALTSPQPGQWEGTFNPTQSGAHQASYLATVNSPSGPIKIGEETMAFDVFPTRLVSVKIVAPSGDHFTATDPLMRPTGLTIEIQLADENGNELSPGEVGAVDPMSVFSIRVLDKDKNDRAKEFTITNTGKPGLFRAENHTLGPGPYEVTVEPATTLAKDFIWADKAWTRSFSGDLSPLVYLLAAAIVVVVIALALGIIRFRAVRVHPLTGYVEVFQEVPELSFGDEAEPSSYRKTVLRKQLPKLNRITLKPRGRASVPVKWIKVTCPTQEDSEAGRAHVEVAMKGKGAPLSTTLDPAQPPTPLALGYFVEKGPRKVELPGPEIADLQFPIPERR